MRWLNGTTVWSGFSLANDWIGSNSCWHFLCALTVSLLIKRRFSMSHIVEIKTRTGSCPSCLFAASPTLNSAPGQKASERTTADFYTNASAQVRQDRPDSRAPRNASGTCYRVPSCACLLYTSPSPRDQRGSRMPSSA